jgi:hypothetical protein
VGKVYASRRTRVEPYCEEFLRANLVDVFRLKTPAGQRIKERIYARQDSLIAVRAMRNRIWQRRQNLNAYVALAEELEAPLITCDQSIADVAAAVMRPRSRSSSCGKPVPRQKAGAMGGCKVVRYTKESLPRWEADTPRRLTSNSMRSKR